MTIKILLDKTCLEHNSGYGHPEKAARIKNIIDYFNYSKKDLDIVAKDIIDKKHLSRLLESIHNNSLIEKVSNSKFNKETYFDQDTIASSKTYDAALKAGSLATSAGLLSTLTESYFSIMRPPGHHATPKRVMGFCYFNNVGLAAQALMEKNKKIAILDFDYHYGNGTADIFWDNPNVLYISIHADPSVNYPNQGFIDEIGSGDGKGYNICIPLTNGAGNNEILYAIQNIVIPVLNDFKPDIIGMSAGFDGYKDDPVGGGYLNYDLNTFNSIGKIFYDHSLKEKTPIFHVLEGGYNIEVLPKLIETYIDPWTNKRTNSESNVKEIKENEVKSRERKTFEYINQMIRPYWEI